MPDFATISTRIPGYEPHADSRAAAEHFDEDGLVALVAMAALSNYFNRVSTTLRIQPVPQG
jgi:alkylhydroperoxidase family enzyme